MERTPSLSRHQRACDSCKRRKIRCDASEKPDLRCSKCIMYGVECRYEGGPEVPVANTSYIDMLEDRLKRMQEYFEQHRSDACILEDINQHGGRDTRTPNGEPCKALPFPAVPPSHRSTNKYDGDLESSDDESDVEWPIIGDTQRYHGKSVNEALIRSIMGFKADKKGPERFGRTGQYQPLDTTTMSTYTDFPPPELLSMLVDAYFGNFNLFLPLLHRPTFDQSVQSGLHLNDEGFGAVLLLVCAIGSRWVPGCAGRQWFVQVESRPWSPLARPQLHDLQICVLMAAYINGTKSAQGSWTILGLGLRMAQDIGAHRRKRYARTATCEDELWKRAFWVLIVMDRLTSFGLGRPSAIQDEDFDLDPITECDDEYWVMPDPALSFQQPAGKPSRAAFTNCMIRLTAILAFASRSLFTIGKSKLLLGLVGQGWKERVVAEIDSALNKWMDTIPSHLCWDPDNQSDTVFIKQSAMLYASFYHAQMCIHQQFIPTPRRPTVLPFPSLAISTNAARSCLRVLDVLHERTGGCIFWLTPVYNPLFGACLMLLINLQLHKHSEQDKEAFLASLRKGLSMMDALRSYTQAVSAHRAMIQVLMKAHLSTAPAATESGKVEHDDLDDLTKAVHDNLRISSDDLEDASYPVEGPFYRCYSSSALEDRNASRAERTNSMPGLDANVTDEPFSDLPPYRSRQDREEDTPTAGLAHPHVKVSTTVWTGSLLPDISGAPHSQSHRRDETLRALGSASRDGVHASSTHGPVHAPTRMPQIQSTSAVRDPMVPSAGCAAQESVPDADAGDPGFGDDANTASFGDSLSFSPLFQSPWAVGGVGESGGWPANSDALGWVDWGIYLEDFTGPNGGAG